MNTPIAHLLITHGSRNPTSAASAQSLLQKIQPHLPQAQLFHAQLEGTESPLHQQILEIAHHLQTQNIHHLTILPLFLIPGIHILQDLPQEQTLLHPLLPKTFHLHPLPPLYHHLPHHPNLFPPLISTGAPPAPSSPEIPAPPAPSSPLKILLTHGSKTPNSDRPIHQLAQIHNALPAYYTTEPSLQTLLTQHQNHPHIHILQHFLFPGTITQKLQTLIQQHQTQKPHQIITQTPTLDQLPTFPSLLAQILTSSHD